MASIVPATCKQLVQELVDYDQLPPGAGAHQVNEVCVEKLVCDPKTTKESCLKTARKSVNGWFSSTLPEDKIVKPNISYVEGDRDRTTVSDCDQKFIEAKITEDEWKKECFSPGTWNFERRDELLKQLDDRKAFEKGSKLFSQFQVRIGPEAVRRYSLFRDQFKNWNNANRNDSLSNMASDDGVLDRGHRLGARVTIGTGLGLTRFLDTNMLIRATVLDLSFYSPNTTGTFGSSDNSRIKVGEVEMYHPFFEHNFFEWGVKFWEDDFLWWSTNIGVKGVTPSGLHAGLAYQVFGTPIRKSDAEKTVFGINDFLSHYLLLGVRGAWDRRSDTQMKNAEFCKQADPKCDFFNDTDYFNGSGQHFGSHDLKINQSINRLKIRTYLAGEEQNTDKGLSYQAYWDLFPSLSIWESGATASAFITKGKIRVSIDAHYRYVKSYDVHDIDVLQSGLEYGAFFSLGFLPAK